MLNYLTQKLQTHSINDDYEVEEKGRGSCPESDSDLEEHEVSQKQKQQRKSNKSNGSEKKLRQRKNNKNSNQSLTTKCNYRVPNIQIQRERDIYSELDSPMNPARHNDDAIQGAAEEQNNSSEEELEVIINGHGQGQEIATDATATTTTTPEDDEEPEEEEEEEETEAEEIAAPTFRRPSTAEKRKRPIDHEEVSQQQICSSILIPGPPLNFCTSPPLEALKPHRSLSTSHILMQQQQQQPQQLPHGTNENMLVDTDRDKNQSTNRLTSSSAKQFHSPARRPFRTFASSTSNGHNERWTMAGPEVVASSNSTSTSNGDEGDSEVERFNFEGIQISYSSSALDMRSVSPPAAKLFCEARRPLKHHNHNQRMQRQRPCLDFDKMQQLKTRPSGWRHSAESEMSVFCW